MFDYFTILQRDVAQVKANPENYLPWNYRDNSFIQITSVHMNRDYVAEALRTPESLGIAGLSVEELGSL